MAQRPRSQHQHVPGEEPERKHGSVIEHRGAIIRGYPGDKVFSLLMEGHPFNKMALGSLDLAVRLVDHWLDHGTFPPPYKIIPRKT